VHCTPLFYWGLDVGVGKLSGLVKLSGLAELSGLADGVCGVETLGNGLVCTGKGWAGFGCGFGMGIKYKTVAAIAKLTTPAIAGTA